MEKTDGNPSPPTAAGLDARRLARGALKAALATIERGSGTPYASLVTVATEPCGTPILLVSRLAVHTQNLLADPRASLLFDGTDGAGDPLAGGRVTVVGKVVAASGATHRRRFLARHPAAQMYADFSDFGFFRLEVERGHYIGGFGRIVDLGREDLVVDLSEAAALVSAETEIVDHMNGDHADAIALYAGRAKGRSIEAGEYRMTGIDPEGFDLVGRGEAVRITFESPIESPADARRVLAALAREAREKGQS